MAGTTPTSDAPVRVKREDSENFRQEKISDVSCAETGAPCGGVGEAEGASQHQAARRACIRELAVHFSGAFDSLLSLVPFSAISNSTEDAEADEHDGDKGKGTDPVQSRSQQKWQLRQKRYHPRVLVATPLRLQEQVASEEARSRQRHRGSENAKQRQPPKQRGVSQTSLGSAKTESGDPATGGLADSRAELQRRLHAKLEELRRVKKDNKRKRGKQKKKEKDAKERAGLKNRAEDGQAREDRGRNAPQRKQSQEDNGNSFEYGAVTCPRERVEVRQANRAGTKKRKLQQAMREIESNRESLQKCQSSEERQRVELQQSMAKVMKKLDGEKVMDDMQRLKKKQKFLEKKKEKAAEKWQTRLSDAKEKKRMALEAKKQQKEERLRAREKRKG